MLLPGCTGGAFGPGFYAEVWSCVYISTQPYAMSGTAILYAAISLSACYAMSSTDKASGTASLRACCAMSGTDRVYGATRSFLADLYVNYDCSLHSQVLRVYMPDANECVCPMHTLRIPYAHHMEADQRKPYPYPMETMCTLHAHPCLRPSEFLTCPDS